MDNENKNKKIFFIVTTFFVGFVLGAIAIAVVGGGNITKEHEALKQAVQQQYPQYFNNELGIFYSGVVENVNSSSIVFKANIPEIVLLASDLQEIMEIQVDENTKIIKNVEKSESEYASDLAEYERAFAEYQREVDISPEGVVVELSPLTIEPFYPSTVVQEEIALNTVKVGDLIRISIQQDVALVDNEDGLLITTITIDENLTETVDEALLIFP